MPNHVTYTRTLGSEIVGTGVLDLGIDPLSFRDPKNLRRMLEWACRKELTTYEQQLHMNWIARSNPAFGILGLMSLARSKEPFELGTFWLRADPVAATGALRQAAQFPNALGGEREGDDPVAMIREQTYRPTRPPPLGPQPIISDTGDMNTFQQLKAAKWMLTVLEAETLLSEYRARHPQFAAHWETVFPKKVFPNA